jgi:hypothetical protein
MLPGTVEPIFYKKDVIARIWTLDLNIENNDVAGFLRVLLTPQEDGTIELTQTGLIDLILRWRWDLTMQILQRHPPNMVVSIRKGERWHGMPGRTGLSQRPWDDTVLVQY